MMYIKALISLLLLLTGPARSEDIYLYTGSAQSGSASIVFALDTGASFNANNSTIRCNIDPITGEVRIDGTGLAANFTPLDGKNGGVQQCAMYTLVKSLSEADGVNIGVMALNNKQNVFNISTGLPSLQTCPGSGGGCLILPLTVVNATTKPALLEWIRNWQRNNQERSIQAPSNRGDGALMQEIWAYFNSKTGISGVDYSAAAYAKPVGCVSNNVLWLGNNFNTQATPRDSTTAANNPQTRLLGTGPVAQNADPAPLPAFRNTITGTIIDRCVGETATSPGATTTFVQSLNTTVGTGAMMLNWAGYMNSNGIPTSAVALQGPSCDVKYAAMMDAMASPELGGGEFYKGSNYSEVLRALNTVVGSIIAKNTSFSSSSLPINVNAQGTFLNRVYIGMFRPAADFVPQWQGNLKQYRIGVAGPALQLQDANGKNAVSTGANATGFIAECARSFWTNPARDTYWPGNSSSTSCIDDVALNLPSNSPDGEIVEKGAAAFVLRGTNPANRNLKTCSGASDTSCTSLIDFVSGATTATSIPQLKLNPGGADRNLLIDWARGFNNDGELGMPATAMRSTVHADVVHSRPAAVNHGTLASPNIVVYYGGNDGIIRAVNGNRGCTFNASNECIPDATGVIGSVPAGGELWSFMAPEFFGNISRLRSNSPAIFYPGAPGDDRTPKSYGFDGPVSAFQGKVGAADKTYVYATMRRGGRAIYAFDVTNPSEGQPPTTPTLLWRQGCPNLTDDVGCTTGTNALGGAYNFSGIGQTWGALKPTYAEGYSSGTSPLLIMPGGYDRCEDTTVGAPKNHDCTTGTTKGNRLYVLDGVTGAIVREFATERAVIAEANIVEDPVTRKAKYAYTVDMRGNVYRLTFGAGAPATWTFARIAALGCATSSCSDSVSHRKFMFTPSVVTPDDTTYYVLLGSGDREKPLAAYTASRNVANYFFMLIDKPTVSSWLTDENAACGANLLCLGSLLEIDPRAASYPVADIGSKKGWYLKLMTGEQVVTSAITLFDTTSFSTHTPQVADPITCSAGLGLSKVYNLNYKVAKSTNGNRLPYQTLLVPGLASSPVGGKVILDDGSVEAFCIGCSATSPFDAERRGSFDAVSRPQRRSFYFIGR